MERVQRIVEDYARFFKLDLGGLTVFTEAASGNYLFNPIITALSADKVYAYIEDSNWGSRSDVRKQTQQIANALDVTNLKVVYKKSPVIIKKCDIITNTGFVRPINKQMIKAMKDTAVVPLMYESWEFKPEDIDEQACLEKGIPILGTNEKDYFGDLFPTMGYLALKMLFEAGIEVYGSKVTILGDDFMARNVDNILSKLDMQVNREKNVTEGSDVDAIIITDMSDLHSYNMRGTQIIHLPRNSQYLGPKYVIGLFMAGLKVGEVMARCRLDGMSMEETIEYALKNSPARRFRLK